jgi:Tfp pilus assembly major pilin PilA
MKGFTLIEILILIVFVILGILGVVTVPGYNDYKAKKDGTYVYPTAISVCSGGKLYQKRQDTLYPVISNGVHLNCPE